MITLLDGAGTGPFLEICDADPLLGVGIRTHLAVYGTDDRYTDFWLAADADGRPCAAIERRGGEILLAATGAPDPAELGEFLRAVGGFDEIRGPAALCEDLLPTLGGSFHTAPAMRYSGGLLRTGVDGVADRIPLDHLYPLISAAFENDEERKQRWYAHASHLFRHGLGYVAGIYEEGRLVSTGGVYATGPRYAVIASLTTDPAYRNRGYAGRIVRRLCARALEDGLIPTLLCADDGLARYYEGLGFEVYGRWGRLKTAP